MTWPDPRIDAVRGCVAIERGPEVLALESTDLAPLGVDDVGQVVIDPDRVRWREADGRVFARHAGACRAVRRVALRRCRMPRPRVTAS